MRKSDKVWPLSVATGALGAIAALTLAAPSAQADPEVPVPPPPPPPGEQAISVQAAPGVDPAPPVEVPHLLSPENLPPGTSDVPVAQEGRGVSYLRDLWHAVQTQEISGSDALLLLTQRPLDPDAVPTNGLPAGPQQAPLPADPAPPEPAPPPPAPLPPAPPTP